MFDNQDDDNHNDYFDGPDIPDTPKPEKKPKLKPDDPRYWDEDESEWEHLRIRNKTKFSLIVAGAVLVAVLIFVAYNRYFNPQIVEATQYGYVDNIEKRGSVFKTYEGSLIVYKDIMDTARVYSRDFIFSATDDAGQMLRQWQHSCKPVRVEYKVYKTVVPWRGESKIVVTKVDTVSRDSILPPEYNTGVSIR